MRIITLLVLACLTVANVVVGTARAADAETKAGRTFTFVIVHGAWAGGWEFKKLGDLLRADGHVVYRPTLTGQGERVHLASPNVDLSLHIQDIVNVILWEDLHDVVLVGHSYGGMVITGVADQVPARIKHVIYVDAFLPEDGESAYTSMGSFRPRTPAVDGFISVGKSQDKSIPRVVPQSEKTFNQPILLRNQGIARKLPSTYILTVDQGREPAQDQFFRFYERAKTRGWGIVVMESDHVVHLSHTEELARLLERTP